MRSSWFIRSLVIQLTALMPVHAIRPMVSYRALELGASAVDLGIVAASYAVLSLVLAIPIGRWVDRVGEQVLLTVGAVTIITAAFLFLAVGNVGTLAVVQSLLGLGQITALIGLQAITTNAGRPEDRDARLGVYTVVSSLGQMIGPAAAGYVFAFSGDSLDTVFITFGTLVVVAAILAVSLIFRPPTEREDGGKERPAQDRLLRSIGTVLRQPSVPHAMVASLTVLTTLDLLTMYLPAYGEANGIRVETIGLLLSLRAAAGVASRILLMPLLRRLGRQRLLVASIAVSTFGISLIVTTGDALWLGLFLSIAGFGLGLGQPLSLAWIADQVPPTIRGTALGVRLFGNRLGQTVLPLAIGTVAGATGVGAIFVTTGAMLAGSGILVSRARMTPPAEPNEHPTA